MLKNRMKRTVALLFALVLTLGCIGVNTTQSFAASSTKVGTAYYTVTSSKNLTAQYAKPTKKTCTSATIPATVKINGKSYKVTSIAANAFSGCTKLKKVTIGKNVTKIGKKAFYGCKALAAVTINTTTLTSSKVGANAFKGINAKAVVTVPSAKLASYKKILVAKGLTGKGQTVKGKSAEASAPATNESEKINLCDPTQSYFEDFLQSNMVIGEDEVCWFRIMNDDTNKESAKYSSGDTVKFRSVIMLEPQIYGWWEKDTRKITGRYVKCNTCGKYFASYFTLGLHEDMELSRDGGCWGSYTLGSANASFQPETWIFMPDPDPCSLVFQYELPQGFSYKEGSLKIFDGVFNYNYNGFYTVNTSGNVITLTIDDVKSMPFHNPYDYEACLKDITYDPEVAENEKGGGQRTSVAVDFEVEVNDNAAINNEIASTVTYSYKGYDHSMSFDAMIHTAGLQIGNTDSEGNSLSGATFDLYQMKTVYASGSNIGTSNWTLLKSGIHAGEVVNGLGIGADRFGNEYRIVQTTAADGYKTASPVEFELSIGMKNGQAVVSAEDEDGNDLVVKNGVVQVTVVNKSSGTAQTSQQSPGNTSTTIPTTNTGTPTAPTTPATSTTTPTKKLVKVKATYYQDGVRDSSITYQQTVSYTETMMDSKNIYSLSSSLFKGCILQKITLNGIEVDSLPAKVEDGSEVCYYYVSQ